MKIDYTIDPHIVRGLDYYTKSAFEFVSNDIGSQSTVCGGGRYDGLIEELGGPKIPGVGFGLGIERLILLLDNLEKDINQQPSLDSNIFEGSTTRDKDKSPRARSKEM